MASCCLLHLSSTIYRSFTVLLPLPFLLRACRSCRSCLHPEELAEGRELCFHWRGSPKLSLLASGARIWDVAGRGVGTGLCLGQRGSKQEEIFQLLLEDAETSAGILATH